MPTILKGEDRIFYIKVSDVYTPVGCLISNSIDEQTEMISTTTPQNAGWRSSIPATQGYTISVEAYQIQTVSSPVSYDYIKGLKRTRTKVEWKVDNGIDIDYGEAYITGISEVAPADELLTFTITLEGYGELSADTDTEAPTAPYQNPFTAVTANYVGLSWDASTDNVAVTGYKVWRQAAGEPSATVLVTLGVQLTYDDYSVMSGGTYGYWISAFDAAGNESGLSNKRLVTSIPPQPAGSDNFIFQDGDGVLYQDGVSALV